MPKKQQRLEVDGRELTISNVDKVFFPESGFTKGEVIAFYSEIADVIVPHLRDRPLTMKRFPEGVDRRNLLRKECAQTHAALGENLRRAAERRRAGRSITFSATIAPRSSGRQISATSKSTSCSRARRS